MSLIAIKKFYNHLVSANLSIENCRTKKLEDPTRLILGGKTVFIILRKNHASVLYISLGDKKIINIDPNFTDDSTVFRDRCFPLLYIFPELYDSTITNITDINVQDISGLNENINIYCVAQAVHFLTYILIYGTSIEEYSLLFTTTVKGRPIQEAHQRLFNEVRGVIIRDLSEEDLYKLMEKLKFYKKYIKYKMNYINLLSSVEIQGKQQ